MTDVSKKKKLEFCRGHWRKRPPKQSGMYPAVLHDGTYVKVQIRFDVLTGKSQPYLQEQPVAWWWSLPFPG